MGVKIKIGKDKRLAREVAKKIEAKLILGDVGIVKKGETTVPTFKGYVCGWEDSGGYHLGWFDKVAKLSLKNSTRRGYKQIIDSHLIPAFGSQQLDEIISRSVGDFVYMCLNKGFRSGTVKNIKNCLSAILRHASTQDGFIESNPARGVLIPHPEDERPAREPDPFTWEERDQIENTFGEHFPRYYPIVVCGFRTGLRIGELIGLKWEDIDFFNCLILVERNITRGKVTTPKSKSSRRPVRMTSQLVSVLKDHRKRIKAEKLRKGWNELPEWIFCNEEGGFINYGNFIHRVWNRAMEKSGLRRRTPHDMRHTYATLRLSKGDSLAEVSKEMGHGSPDITYRTYYKWLPKESRSNIDELDRRPESSTIRNLSATESEKGLTLTG
jgi:integrase